ncbi:4-(cytidine 5'-diphospho)-2-C-methyl-D-erythritol kinase [Marinospirillum perlucidum]|uniref:4-(cytidine 5'-diphospho)-2-C-methyl-D-erythritol kinase n=1 Tax=Marinospirillum perlucidum TaxID=1982602 RepID=UPI000DF2D0DB|nr:4-(cytidine 5'-diphospho)-2-C-methyl-D-erythritol kinase [Marinospirillum perlucidum]
MKQLSLPAPAKLNLFLQITGQRPDGYHELQTLFHFLDISDELDFTLRKDGEIQLETPLPGVPRENNLVWKAAQLLATYRANPSQGVSIRIDKQLPMGGGLGAGSSDAATTLLALNHLWDLRLDLDQLAKLGLQLGADVPVFLRGETAWAEGIGEQLQPWAVEEKDYLILHPGCSCSTADFFRHPELNRQSTRITPHQAQAQLGHNVFTSLARELYPAVDQGFEWLQAAGLQPFLTGTGACIYAVIDEASQGRQLLEELPKELQMQGARGWLAKGCNRSPAHRQLAVMA